MTPLVFIFVLAMVQVESGGAILTSSPIFGPRQVTGLLGGSVTVKCFYPQTSVNRHDRKYWCKESTRQCATIISSSGFVAPEHVGRILLTDFPENGMFTIEMSELKNKDMGSYKCGIGLNSKGLSFKVKLDVSDDTTMPEEAELFYAGLRGSLSMHCAFNVQYSSFRKYLCKMTKSQCSTIIDTLGNIDPYFKGRVLLSNSEDPGSFSIFMTDLNKEDSGLYLCGVGRYGEDGESKKMDVHVYEESSVSQRQSLQTGVLGGSVSVQCHYDPKGNDTIKYWCKWKEYGCTLLINNFGFVLDSHEGRIVMHDSPENGTFTIILNLLQKEDAGHYWCMTDGKQERKSTVELRIIEGQPSLSAQKEINVLAGTSLTLSCSYPCKYVRYEKYWCKWKNTGCDSLMSYEQNQTGLIVNCDQDNRILRLNFDQVTTADQGWYWCGLRNAGRYGETVAVYLSVQGELSDSEEVDAENGFARMNLANRNSALNEAKAAAGAEIATASPVESNNPTVLLSVVIPLVIVLLFLAAVFAVFKLKHFNNSDRVSVGSYRTNISLSDFENLRQYGAKDNVCMEHAHETQIGRMDEIPSADISEEADKPKKAKRGSKEELEMAYTTFLLKAENLSSTSSQQQ